MNSRSLLMWVLAILITLASAIYQRMTGPTYPLRGQVIVGSETIKYRLARSSENPGDAEVSVPAPDPDMSGSYEYRRHPSDDPWTLMALERKGDLLVARIPSQPAAGKVIYHIFVAKPGIGPVPLTEDPVTMRYKDHVPRIPILYPHILLMFVGMLCSTRAGLEALARQSGTFKLVLWTVIPLFLGGIVLGPIVQKYAFGSYWTGWPVGKDLTDNKTAVALVFWVIALWRLRKKPESRAWVIAAAAVTLVVFAIPHSVLGSEIDYTQPGK